MDKKEQKGGAAKSATLEKVQEILRKYKGQPQLVIAMETKFEELELDSLDTVDLVMEIEDQMGVAVEMSKEITTIGHLVEIIDKQAKK